MNESLFMKNDTIIIYFSDMIDMRIKKNILIALLPWSSRREKKKSMIYMWLLKIKAYQPSFYRSEFNYFLLSGDILTLEIRNAEITVPKRRCV